MPNVRDRNKTMIGCYVDREIKAALKEHVARLGITTTDFVLMAIVAAVDGKRARRVLNEI